VSVVTYMELIVGCQNKRSLQSVESFLEDFKLVSIDPAIAEQALQMLKQYRLSHGLLIADALIAATTERI
ncbi:MAG: PIN domain-containing protein, partial [Cyanobacteria bacterium J06598_3]